MALNPNIIAGIRPVEVQQNDPLERYGKMLSLQNAMGQGDLQRYQLSSAQRSDALANQKLEALKAAGNDPQKIYQALIGVGDTTGAASFRKSGLDIHEAELKIAASKTAMYRDQLQNVNDPESAAAWMKAQHDDPDMAATPIGGSNLETSLSKIPTTPAEFAQWKQQAALGMTKFTEMNKPQISTQNLGGSSQVVATPGLGGAPQVLSNTPTTQSPDSVASTITARRGQNMTDARAREMNGILQGGGNADQFERMAQGIAAGQLAPLSGYSLKSPQGMRLMSRVLELNPQYNGQDYGSQAAGLKQFTSGKLGNSVRSFNVSISHLDTLDKLGEALQNGDVQAFNKVGNYYATQTGQAAPTDFNAAKKIVADEIVKAIVGSGGGVADREEAAQTVSAANSPAQLRGVISTYKELMNGQLNGLKQQYEQTTGRQDFDRFLSEGSKGELGNKSAPKPGTVVKGHIYLGGDPSKPTSWKAQ